MSLLLAVSLAATPPDPGQQDFAALTALAGGLVATALGLVTNLY
jgi:hypothetical protein